MKYKVDFHAHTKYSDGASTPEELINVAVREGVKAIALTDHDTIMGLEETSLLAKANGIEFLNGIEISSLYKDGRLVHILGIGIDPSNEEFLEAYNEMRETRDEGVQYILESIKEKGLDINIEDLRNKAHGKYLDRYNIFRYMSENNLGDSSDEIWHKYLDPIPYRDKELIKTEDAIRIIKAAGGLSFVAHYNKRIGFEGLTKEEMEAEFKYLIDLGLDGVERYYPTFLKEDYDFLDYLIDKYDLMISGGTDYHGKNRPEVELGSGMNNNLDIPYEVYTNILDKLK